ncbi:DUF456 domain-containing protein [Micrococcus lylae]|uniref:DUF456 domain-containing protein n=1 Tax=Micrococcus lylae TaxID=1273 RepID=A0ABY2JYT1_9MICC|nr:DUF456 domain-containing protein [Micrococcus lylae]MCT2007848.1 DUF456 domain-containing protein [Micrococcus lylae]MCT2071579.1 DUF456 domain-containing protein [Micrococcus lylae]TFH98813.1 DUF456 domain-containing protein [Micrococcus lylae]
MELAVVATVVALVLLAVGAFGTVYPILPGSVLTAVTAVAWAWVVGSTASWTFGLIAAGLAIAGASASAVLTGRRLYRERVPRGPILVGIVAGVIGMVVIPVVGLFVGFAAGLFGAEWARRRDVRAALSSSVGALKAMGLGMLIEFACACLAASMVTLGALVHFFA